MNRATAQQLLACKKAVSVGLYGEQIARDLLEKRGYIVTPQPVGAKVGDLHAVTPDGELIRVEVKTSRRGAAGWQWTLWKRHSQNHRHSDVVLLLAAVKSGRVIPFVIPTQDIRDLHSIKFRSHPESYAGRFKVYRQRPHALSLEVEPCHA